MWFIGTLTGYTGDAGYAGIKNLNVGVITITGEVNIDIATATNGIYSHATAPGGPYPTSVVRIMFDDTFTLNVAGPITFDVVFAGDNILTQNPYTLGDIYISGLNVAIFDGSWVDIWAH